MKPFNTSFQASRVHQPDMMEEECCELEPHSPSESETNWTTEKSDVTSGWHKLHPLKSSHCRLLAWVAIFRHSHNLITQLQRCTCPMAGCGSRFTSPESMHWHLTNSPCLSKTTYYCFEIDKNMRVGKCDSEGCQFLKGRFVSVVSSSVRSMRRHLSDQLLRSSATSQAPSETEHIVEESTFMETPSQECVWRSELPSSCHLRPVEMWTSSNGIIQSEYEIDSPAYPLELSSTLDQYHESNHTDPSSFHSLFKSDKSATDALLHGGHEYSTMQTSFPAGLEQVVSGFVNKSSQIRPEAYNGVTPTLPTSEMSKNTTSLAELCADTSSWRSEQGRETESVWPQLSPSNFQELSACRSASDGSNTPLISSFMYHNQDKFRSRQEYVTTYNYHDCGEKMVVDDFRSTLGLCELPGNIYDTVSPASRTGSSTDSDSSLVSAVFSSGSDTMSSQSSVAGRDSIHHDVTQISFFGEGSTMFEEPSPMDTATAHSPSALFHSHADRNIRQFDDGGVSIDNYVAPGSYLSSLKCNSYVPAQLRITKQVPIQESVIMHDQVSRACPDTEPNIASSPREAYLSPITQGNGLLPGKAYCRHCQRICDSSNRSRHEKTCKQNPERTNLPLLACQHPGCTSTFNRKDNLLQHQRLQNHLTIGNVELKVSLTPTPGSPVWDLAMEALGQQRGLHGVDIQGRNLWRGFKGERNSGYDDGA